VDVEEYKRLRTTVKLRLDDCDHEVAGQLRAVFVEDEQRKVVGDLFKSTAAATFKLVLGTLTPGLPTRVSMDAPASLPIAGLRPKSTILSTLTPLPPVKMSCELELSSTVCASVDATVDANISRRLSFIDDSKSSHGGSGAPQENSGGIHGALKRVKAEQLRCLPSLQMHRVEPRSGDKAPHAPLAEWSNEGGLSKLASGVDLSNPKFQVVINAQRAAAHSPPKAYLHSSQGRSLHVGREVGSSKGAGDADSRDWCGGGRVAENDYYFEQRQARPLYRNKELHIMVLELALHLILDPDGPLLDPQHTHQFPLEKHRPNIPFLLRTHMNHPANERVLPQLLSRVSARSDAAHRLLKLLIVKLFQPSRYSNRDPKVRFRGAYGTVYRVLLPSEPFELAIKVVELPKDMHAPCTLQDLFTEVSIMDHLRREARMCHLYDYGVDNEHCYIVTAWYRMSLRHWRTNQPEGFLQHAGALVLLLAVGTRLLAAMCRLADAHVVHYDIKCDNVLLVADRDVSDSELLDQRWRTVPAFDLVVTDFGESKLYSAAQDGYTTRNRGTEYIKSPEMLTVANASSKERANFDRRKKVGANKASDVWSAACVLYELLTGDYLFYDEDWIRFFIRVTGASPEDLIPAERLRPLLDLPGGKHLADFFSNALIRDPLRRPSMHDLAKRWSVMSAAVANQQPQPEAASDAAAGIKPPARLPLGLGKASSHDSDEASHDSRVPAPHSSRPQGLGKAHMSIRAPQAPDVVRLSAKRVQRDASRASAMLLHEPILVSEVDREMQGKAAVSLGFGSSGHILLGGCPLDICWVDGKPLQCLAVLGVGHLLDCTGSPAAATAPTDARLPGKIYAQSAIPSLLMGPAAPSSTAATPVMGGAGRGKGTEARPGVSAEPLTMLLRQLAKDVAFIQAVRREGSTVLVFDKSGGGSWAAGVVIAYLMQVL
jgi:serine/threonine protein kinase